MLTGVISSKNLPTFDDDVTYPSGGYYGHPPQLRAITPEEAKALQEARACSLTLGFHIGTKVKRKWGQGAFKDDVGKVKGFAYDLKDGFYLGKPTPIMVEWENSNSKWVMSYENKDLEIVP